MVLGPERRIWRAVFSDCGIRVDLRWRFDELLYCGTLLWVSVGVRDKIGHDPT